MIEITDLSHNAKGIGRLNGKIVFIDKALPKDIVEISVIKEKKNYIEAKINRIIKESNLRVESPCIYFDKCGGCDLLNLSYENQIKYKYDKVCNIIDKYLSTKIKINDVVKSSNVFNYRNKVTFQVNKKLGFYGEGSYDIVEIDKCIISDEKINNSIKFLKKLDLNDINKITCRTNSNDLMIIIETSKNELNVDCIKNIASSIYLKHGNEYKLIYGDEYITETIGKFKYLVSPDSFFQINLDVCEKLYDKIKEYVGINNNVLDLYCGTGSIGIFVNDKNKVLAVEINKSAVRDAKKNMIINKVDNVNVICEDSGKCISNVDFKPDIIIVDPPRTGLDECAIKNIIKLNPKKIIYVSCNPITLVRDLNCLINNYDIKEITPFDMFPNTYHVECVCCLNKK